MSIEHPVAIVMGGERKGMRPRQAALCDQFVRIPMAGTLDSLNLAVATSLTLYEVWRGRNPVRRR
jgi:tRNA G18 (ribose-2'-O)-methylase SpoU